MESIPFLTVDNETISLKQALNYLKVTGGLQRTLIEIIRQHILEKELNSRTDIAVQELPIDQAMMDFRLQNQLTDAKKFQMWLKNRSITYEEFQNNIAFAFKLEKFKEEVTAPKLEAYFNDRKPLLDRIVLSRLIVSDRNLAENLKAQLQADKSKFEQFVTEYSIAEDRVVKGMMGAVSRGQLIESLRASVNSANPGEIVGPIEIEGRYCLFRVEHFLPVALEGQLKQELKNQLFDQWFQEKLQTLTVKLEV